MNTSQLVRAASESTGLGARAVDDVLDAVTGTIVAEVRAGRKVTIVGFGTFTPVRRAPRLGRNPRTGAAVAIPASKGVRFATGSAFKSALNLKEDVPMAASTAARKAGAKTPAPTTAARTTARQASPTRAPAKATTQTAAKRATTGTVAATGRVAKKATATQAAVRKTAAKKATATKAAVHKATATKAPAKKTAAKKATARTTR